MMRNFVIHVHDTSDSWIFSFFLAQEFDMAPKIWIKCYLMGPTYLKFTLWGEVNDNRKKRRPRGEDEAQIAQTHLFEISPTLGGISHTQMSSVLEKKKLVVEGRKRCWFLADMETHWEKIGWYFLQYMHFEFLWVKI